VQKLFHSLFVQNLTITKGGIYMSNSAGFGSGFALLVVLFILLIIVGCSWYGGYGGW
jgi:uncharacterized protein (TIGR01732 family)